LTISLQYFDRIIEYFDRIIASFQFERSFVDNQNYFYDDDEGKEEENGGNKNEGTVAPSA
jgi:hypothetical protein